MAAASVLESVLVSVEPEMASVLEPVESVASVGSVHRCPEP